MVMSRHKRRKRGRSETGFSRRESLRRNESGDRLYLTVEDAAALISVPIGEVLKWVRSETVPCHKRKGKIFLQRDELLEAVNAR